MPQLFNKIVGDTPEQQAKIDEIMRRGEEERRQIARENLLDNARIAGGALLSGASALPFFNIPYIGTGIGGALEGAGQAIMKGKSGQDIAQDAGIGFAIGETVGAIPYAGKFAGKTNAGQAVAKKANSLYDKIMATDAAVNVAKTLDTDVKDFATPLYRRIKAAKAYDTSPFVKLEKAKVYDSSDNDFVENMKNFDISNYSKDEYKQLRKDARKFYSENFKNTDGYREDIKNFHFGNAGIDEQVSKGIHNTDILPVLKEQIETGAYKGVRNDRVRDDIDFFHIIENKHNGKNYEYQIANDVNGNKFYFAKNLKEENPPTNWNQHPASVDYTNSITDYDKNLKSFMENSKVVDENGNPLVVYHGSPDFNIKVFDANKSNYGDVSKGFNFFTNKKSGYENSAKDYAEFAGTNGYKRPGQIYETYLNMNKPLHIKYENQLYWDSINNKPVNNIYGTPIEYYDKNYKDIKNKFINGDYDGLIIENLDKNIDDSILYAVPSSNQIKSVQNQGTFDPTNPNIYKSVLGGLGLYELLRGKTQNEQYN